VPHPSQREERRHRVVLGRLGQQTFAAERYRPVMVVGPQRSGKTSAIVVPTLLEWDGPAIVTSIRTDVLAETIDARSQKGKVSVIDPGGIVKNYGVVGWSPLELCGTWAGAVKMSRGLTEAGRASGGLQEGNFWFGKAGQLLAPLLYAAGGNAYGMADVVRWVKTQETFEVRALLQALGVEEAMHSAESAFMMEDRARSSVYATLEQALGVFDNPTAMASADATQRFLTTDFCNGDANTAYLCAPPDTQEEYAPLFTAFVRSVLREAYVRNMDYVDGRDAQGPPVPLLVLLDEAANITPLENLATLATTAAGTGIQLITVFHDLSQVAALYGEDTGRSIANNCSALLVLPGNRDPATARLIDDMLGGDQVAGMVDRRISASGLRKLPPRVALSVYENLPPIVLNLRSSYADEELVALKTVNKGQA
jgi:type IV secretion system protein VirD4